MICRILRNRLVGAKNLYSTKQYDGDIQMIDAMYADLDQYSSTYTMFEGDEAIIIEPCTFRAERNLVQFLKDKLPFENVKYIIPTHVHLDHASSTGTLANLFPNATVLAHPKCAKFLKDPDPLVKGATQIYGEDEVELLYGKVLPVEESRIREIEDGEIVKISENRSLKFLYTLGHATHHFVVHDSLTNGVFTGDSFGMNYPKFGRDYILPSTTPIDFDPILMKNAVDEVMEVFQPDQIYLTHFDVYDDPEHYQALNHLSIDLTVNKLVKKVPDQATRLMRMYDKNEKLVDEKLMEWGVEVMWDILEEIIGAPKSTMENYKPILLDSYLNALGSVIYVKRTLKKHGELPDFS